ncbi:anthranilate synthase component II [Steroidobacter denitrificans]|uniref:Anthranilate synthase component II n=1 Tax=Steroidobacter denitrificans TaxID=465721 RepID=A0A127FDA6_STEDE|nr:aminodeoxychorismate/anthranilate synthase component II [Steroidobacter denitrificans]AMN48357.1 anthranilate synthase component II [Steroidobacter denitrificans]
MSATNAAAARLLLIDNYDSFTYNLVQAFLVLGAEVLVHRNDRITVEEARALCPTHLCISPGPGTPQAAGVSMSMIEAFAGEVPILGVCLGHQCLVEVFGGEVVRAPRLMHGKTSPVHHSGQGILRGLPDPFEAGRYHSLIVRSESLPEVLEVSAHTAEGEIMGVRHKTLAIEGVQFHPESILTPHGPMLLGAFLAIRSARREV